VKKLEYIYGIDLLIKAFAIVLKEHVSKGNSSDIKLVIVGDGSLKSELELLVIELGLSDVVNFVASIPNDMVPQYINEMDVFVVPSRIESFGVAVIEALACERPCIVANTGGLPEVVLNTQTGIVVDYESESAIAKAIIELINNPQKAIDMGVSGRKDMLAKYSDEYAVSNMIAVYHKFHLNNAQ
jgi:glycosyltransferase involved in cell wall biosynthesis